MFGFVFKQCIQAYYQSAKQFGLTPHVTKHKKGEQQNNIQNYPA